MLFQLVAVVLATARVGSAHSTCTQELRVDTTVGTVIGTIDPAVSSVHQWLGIPFAEPPLGSRRFLPPTAKAHASGLINATQLQPSCQQWLTTEKTIYNQEVPEFLPPHPYSEDCLYLNVIVPQYPKNDDLPVLVWLHGGQTTWGGISTPYEKPEQWVQRSQEHIVVQVNYLATFRNNANPPPAGLNIFGFPNAKGLNPSELNLGILDQRLAIEWVRDNIARFGGDPERIIVWGQSSGGGLADNYQYAFAHDPIAKGVISQSASAYMSNLSSDPLQTSFSYVAEQFNCSSNRTPQEEVDCMRGVDAEALESFLQQHSDSGATPALVFGATADNLTAFTRSQYLYMAESKDFSKLPLLVGTNLDEGATFAPFSVAGPSSAVIEAITLEIIQCLTGAYINARAAGNGRTFRYLYGGNFTNVSPLPWMGSYHFAEIPLVMGTYSNYRGQSTAFETQLSETMQDLWLTFAKNPKDGLIAKGWPAVVVNGSAMTLGVDGVVTSTQRISVIDAECSSL